MTTIQKNYPQKLLYQLIKIYKGKKYKIKMIKRMKYLKLGIMIKVVRTIYLKNITLLVKVVIIIM